MLQKTFHLSELQPVQFEHFHFCFFLFYLISGDFWLILQSVNLVPPQDNLGVGSVPHDFDRGLTGRWRRTRGVEGGGEEGGKTTRDPVNKQWSPELTQHEGDFSLSVYHPTVRSERWLEEYVRLMLGCLRATDVFLLWYYMTMTRYTSVTGTMEHCFHVLVLALFDSCYARSCTGTHMCTRDTGRWR